MKILLDENLNWRLWEHTGWTLCVVPDQPQGRRTRSVRESRSHAEQLWFDQLYDFIDDEIALVESK